MLRYIMKQANSITKEIGIGIDQGLKAAWSIVRFGNPIRYTKVSGVSHGQGQMILKGLSRSGIRHYVRLKRERHNVYDDNAIAVYVVVGLKTAYKIGYINALRARLLSYEMDSGKRVLVLSSEITGEGKEFYGMNLKYVVI